jgi:glycosyltransferase involved in cell wall biosynthesis
MAAAARARDSMRIPLIYEARGLWFETSLAEGKLSPYSDKHMMLIEEELTAIECADHVVAIAGALRDEFIRWGARSDTISVVPNGVDLADFPPLPPDTTLADHLGLTGSCVVGYITSVRSIEGLDILIRAVRSARAAGTSIKALIVGDGEDLPRLKRLAVELKIADAVVFTGRIPHQDVARYYSIIDLFVVPRIDAPVNRLVTPLKPYEAMAMERTVLVSRLPALMEMIKEGETGYAFPAGDFSALATLLTRLCADAHARDVVGMSARRFVANERAWKNITQQYLALYRNALDKSRSSHL